MARKRGKRQTGEMTVVSTWVPRHQREQLQALAAQRATTIASVVRRLVRREIARELVAENEANSR